MNEGNRKVKDGDSCMAQRSRTQKQKQKAFRKQVSAPGCILSSTRPLVAPAARIIKQVSQDEGGSAARHSTYHYEYIENRVSTAMMQSRSDQKFQEQVDKFKKLIAELPLNKLIYFVGLILVAGFVGATNEFAPEYLIIGVSVLSFIMFLALKV